jgi:LuxR family quorum-sensing system transcriptional regulator CciR
MTHALLSRETHALSSREKTCLSWTAHGKSSWEIAKILKISENTVNFHIKKALSKLGTNSRTSAVVKAIQLGIIDGPDFK